MTQPSGSQSNTVMKGCAIGCVIVLVAVILGAIAFALMVRQGFRAFHGEFREEFTATYNEHIDQGRIPAEHAPAFAEMHEIVLDDGTSFSATALAMITMEVLLEDGQVDEAEAAILDDVLAELRNRPDLGPIALGQIVQRYAVLEERSGQVLERLGEFEQDVDVEPGAAEPVPDGSPGAAPAPGG